MRSEPLSFSNQVSLASCMIGYAGLWPWQSRGLDVEQVLEVVASGMGSSRALKEACS